MSVIVPTYKDEGYLEKCIESVKIAREKCEEEVEVIVAYNDPSIGKLNSCNICSQIARGETLIFIDADSTISPNFLVEVSKKAKSDYFVGGGTKWVRMERLSIGIICWMIYLGIYFFLKQVTVGVIWVRKNIFTELEGFSRNPYSKFRSKYYDLDFAIRLKEYAKLHYKKFESIKNGNWFSWSTRKFDWYGDWHWLQGYKTEDLS